MKSYSKVKGDLLGFSLSVTVHISLCTTYLGMHSANMTLYKMMLICITYGLSGCCLMVYLPVLYIIMRLRSGECVRLQVQVMYVNCNTIMVGKLKGYYISDDCKPL